MLIDFYLEKTAKEKASTGSHALVGAGLGAGLSVANVARAIHADGARATYKTEAVKDSLGNRVKDAATGKTKYEKVMTRPAATGKEAFKRGFNSAKTSFKSLSRGGKATVIGLPLLVGSGLGAAVGGGIGAFRNRRMEKKAELLDNMIDFVVEHDLYEKVASIQDGIYLSMEDLEKLSSVSFATALEAARKNPGKSMGSHNIDTTLQGPGAARGAQQAQTITDATKQTFKHSPTNLANARTMREVPGFQGMEQLSGYAKTKHMSRTLHDDYHSVPSENLKAEVDKVYKGKRKGQVKRRLDRTENAAGREYAAAGGQNPDQGLARTVANKQQRQSGNAQRAERYRHRRAMKKQHLSIPESHPGTVGKPPVTSTAQNTTTAPIRNAVKSNGSQVIPRGLSRGAKIGIGAGVGAAVLGAGYLLGRNRRQNQAA